MKKILIIFSLISASLVYTQDLETWKKMSTEQRKESMKKMTPAQRSQLMNQYKQNMMVDELKVPADKQTEFAALYREYEESQKKIKQGFKPQDNYDQMSDDEARAQLETSFEVGEKLLQNRRMYSEKFQRVVKPQQVLEMFQNEGAMRSRMMDRRIDGSTGRSASPTPRARFENGGGNAPSLRQNSSGTRGFRN